jgi:hypothetical protein
MTVESLIRERYDGLDQRDVFSKAAEFTVVERARELGIYPFQALDNNDGTVARSTASVLMFGSNNYPPPRHRRSSGRPAAITKYGTPMTGSRLSTGAHLHEELETRIARFLHKRRLCLHHRLPDEPRHDPPRSSTSARSRGCLQVGPCEHLRRAHLSDGDDSLPVTTTPASDSVLKRISHQKAAL